MYLVFIAAAVSGMAAAGGVQEAYAQQASVNLTAVGSLADSSDLLLGQIRGVDVFTVNGTIYTAAVSNNEDGLQIVDIADPTSPTGVGQVANGGALLLDAATSVNTFTRNNKIYAVVTSHGEDGIDIFEVTNPARPVSVSRLSDSTSPSIQLDGASSVTVFHSAGGTPYVLATSQHTGGLRLVSLSNPGNPIPFGQLLAPDLRNTVDVDTFKTGGSIYAVVASWAQGLQIIDVSNPESSASTFEVVGSLTDSGDLLLNGIRDVATFETGGSTYVAVASHREDGLQIIDVSDPDNPSAAGKLADGGDLRLDGASGVDIFRLGSSVYAAVAAQEDNGLQIIDVTDPGNPSAVTSLGDSSQLSLAEARVVTVFTSGESPHAVVGSYTEGLQVVKLGDIDTTGPEFASAALDGNTDTMMITFDETIDVSETDLSKLYVSDAGETNEVALTGATFDDTVPDSDTISLTLTQSQLNDIARMATPQLDIAAGAVSDLFGNQMKSAADNPITTATPDSPIPSGNLPDDANLLLAESGGVDTFEIGGSIYAVAVSSDVDGIQIVDVTNPAAPAAAGSLQDDDDTLLLWGARAVDTFETGGKTYAVVASNGDDGVEIIDVSDPDNPASVGRVKDDGSRLLDGANGVTTFTIDTNTYAAVTSQHDDGLQIIDVTNPASPAAAGNLADDSSRLLVDTSAVAVFETGGSTYAAVASWGEPGLQIIDVSDPDNPAAAGNLADDNDLLLRGIRDLDTFETGGSTYAVATSHLDHGLQIIDVSDPGNPAAAGKLADGGDLLLGGASGVEVFRTYTGVYAAVASEDDDGVQVVGITDPDNPAAAGFLGDGPSLSLDDARDLAVFTSGKGTYAVVASHMEGLQVVGLDEDDTEPEFASATLDGSTGAMMITFDETIDVSETDLSKLYVSDAGETNEVALTGAAFDDTVPDSDTTSITLTQSQLDDIARMATPQLDIAAGAVSDLFGNQIESTADNPITTASPANPIPSGRLPDDANLLLAESRGVDTFEIGGSIYAVAVSSDVDGIQIVDVTNPAAPAATGSLQDDDSTLLLWGARAVDTFETGGKTYAVVASNGDDGVEIIDVSDPDNPASVGRVKDDGSRLLDGANGVTTFTIDTNTYAAVTSEHDDGLQIIDVTNPASPAAAGNLADDSSRLLVDTSAVAVFETGGSTYAVVASWGQPGLQIIDVSDPDNPAAAGNLADDNDLLLRGIRDLDTFETGGSTYAVATSHLDHGLQIIDVSDPGNPAAAGKLADGGDLRLAGASGVEVFRTYTGVYAAVASEGDDGVQVVDIADPDNPAAAGFLGDGPSLSLDKARDLAVFTSGRGTYAVVASDTEGLQVVGLDEDDTEPEFASATMDRHTGAVVVTFSETIDVSETDLSKLYVSDAGETNEVALTGATFDDTVPDSDTIYLTLTQSQLDDIARMATPQLDIAAGAVSDLFGNQIESAADNPITTATPDSPIPSKSIPDTASLLLDLSRGVDTFEIGGSTYAVAVSGSEDGIQIMDITDPAAPAAAGQLDDDITLRLDGARAVDTFETGGKTYAVVASNGDDGVEIIDVTDPDNPASVGRVADGGNRLLEGANAVTTFTIGTNTYAAVTSQHDGGLQLVHVTDPSSLTAPGELADNGSRLLADTSSVDTFKRGGSTYAVVASWGDDGLEIIDVSNPSSPAETGRLADNTDMLLRGIRAVDTFEVGGFAYVAVASHLENGLQIINVTDPDNPSPAGKLVDGGDRLLAGASGVEMFWVGQTVYAAVASESDDGLQIVDITNPDNPAAAGSIGDDLSLSLENARDLALFEIGGDVYAVVATDTEGLQTVKLAEGASLAPNSAPVLGTIGDQTATPGVQLSITPTVTDADTTDTHTYSISRGTLPAAAVFDTSNGSIVWTPVQADAGQTHEVTITVDDGRGGTDSESFDIVVGDAPPTLTLTPVGNIGDSQQLLLDGAFGVDTFTIDGSTYAAVASEYDDGIQIINVTDPASPTAAGSLEDNNDLRLASPRGVAVFTIDGSIYAVVASHNDDGIQIVNVTDPASLQATGRVSDTPSKKLDGAFGVAVFTIDGSTYAAVSSYYDGIQIVNVTDPASPTAAGSLEDTNSTRLDGASGVDVFTIDGRTYAAVASVLDNGLQIVDVTDPVNPIEAGSLGDGGFLRLGGALDVAVITIGQSTYAVVVAEVDNGIQIVDVSNPASPTAAGRLGDNGALRLGSPRNVDVFTFGSNTYAVVTSLSDNGIQLVDITDPANLTAAGNLGDMGSLELNSPRGVDIFMIGQDIYAAVAAFGDAGLQIVELNLGEPSNDPPVAPSETATTAEDTPITITPSISDPDTSDTPVISAIENPPNGSATHDDNTITYTPDQDYTGTDTFGYTVSDGTNTAQGTITITVTRDNNAPVLATIGDRNATPGAQLSIMPKVTDADPTDTHAYSISRGTLPAAAVFDTSNGSIVWTPVQDDIGQTHDVTITVDDGRGGTDSQTFEIAVTLYAIMLNGTNPWPHELGDPYVDPGATISGGSTVDINASAVDVNVRGDYIVNFMATDPNNNPVTATRIVQVRDTTPPEIMVSGEDPVTIPLGSTYIDAGATSTDNDPNYADAVSVDDTLVDTDRPGTYTVTYTATDDAGNTKIATRTVTVPAEYITMGALIPQTGGLGSHLGEHHTFAANAAVEDLNAYLERNGAVWRADQLVINDTEAADVQTLIRSLDSANITLVSGPVRSSELDAVRNYADSNGMILVSCCSTAPSLAIEGDNIFRLAPDDSQQGSVIAGLLGDEYEKDVMVVVWRGDIWGEGIRNSAVTEFEALGGTADELGSYDPDDPDLDGAFEALAARLETAVSGHVQEAGADRVSVLFIGQEEMSRFVAKAAGHPVLGTVQWMGSDASVLDNALVDDPGVFEFLRDANFQASVFAEDSDSPAYRYLTDIIDDEFGTAPAVYTYGMYDTIWVLGLALEEAGWDAEPGEIRAALPEAASRYVGAIGDIELNAAGDLDWSMYAVWGIDDSGWMRLGIWDDGFKPDSRGGGNDDEWQTAPTFGVSPQTGGQMVSCGYSMDGICRDVLDYHVDYRRESIQTDTKHDFTLRAHSAAGVQQFQIGFGVPGVGSPIGDAEAVLTVELGRDYTADSTYEILDAVYTDPNDVIGEAALGVELVGCMSPADPTRCVELSIEGLLFREQMYHEPFVIYVMDVQRWSAQNYMNDGLLVQGDSMNPVPLDTAGIYKRGQQYEAAVIQLERTDKLADLWADQWGNEWARNSHGTWYRTVPDAFERHQDVPWKVMNRMNSNFATLVQAEQDRAVLVFDASQLIREPGSVIPYEHPAVLPEEVRLERLADSMAAERQRAQEIIDRMMSMTYHVSD